MEEEIIVTESLRKILIDIASSIKESEPLISNKNLKRRLRTNFYHYVGNQFSVDKNEEMDSFLKEGGRCITEELTDFSRTYFLERITQQHVEYLGFVTIRLFHLDLSDLEDTERKKLILSGKSPKNITHIPCYLIEQVAKNSKISDNPISAKDLLDLAFQKLKLSNTILGSALIVLAGVNIEKIINIYSDYGFKSFGKPYTPDGSSISYQNMYYKLPTGIDSFNI